MTRDLFVEGQTQDKKIDFAAEFEQYVRGSEHTNITAESVCSANYPEVITLLDECFSSAEDRESYRTSLSHAASGKTVYFSPFVRDEIHVLGSFLFRREGVPAAVTCVHHPRNASEGEYWVGWTGVASKYRSQGIGKLVVGWMEHLMRNDNGKVLKVSTGNNPYYSVARALYASLGFAVVPEKSVALVETSESTGAIIYQKCV